MEDSIFYVIMVFQVLKKIMLHVAFKVCKKLKNVVFLTNFFVGAMIYLCGMAVTCWWFICILNLYPISVNLSYIFTFHYSRYLMLHGEITPRNVKQWRKGYCILILYRHGWTILIILYMQLGGGSLY